MDEKKYCNARWAIGIVSVLTLLVAGFELFIAYTQYQSGMERPESSQAVICCRQKSARS